MLYCGLSELEPGMVVAASVFHPRRPEVELLARGVELDPPILARLRQLGVTALWVEHDLTTDLDKHINATPSEALRTAYQQLKHDFRDISASTVSAGHVQTYRQIVMQLVCELIANRNLSGLTERLVAGPRSLFNHSANVSYLSICVGLELETYVVKTRRAMALEHARDLTALGIGAMLHDIGKAAIDDATIAIHEADFLRPGGPKLEDDHPYRKHPVIGFEMLRETRAPASARQIVLNHHQRWDGTGFPDMALVTSGRRKGALHGEHIHVFSRIVAAANTLDNLLHDTRVETDDPDASAALPTVAALHAFASSRFDGWFDPVVRDAMLRKVPPFAIGSRVVLNDGRAAVVVAPSVEQPCRPVVRLLEDTKPALAQTEGEPTALDLRLHRNLKIVRCGGQDVERYLYELPEGPSLAVAAISGKLSA